MEINSKFNDGFYHDNVYEYYGLWFECPSSSCKNDKVLPKANYCSNCGIDLQWNNDNLNDLSDFIQKDF